MVKIERLVFADNDDNIVIDVDDDVLSMIQLERRATLGAKIVRYGVRKKVIRNLIIERETPKSEF